MVAIRSRRRHQPTPNGFHGAYRDVSARDLIRLPTRLRTRGLELHGENISEGLFSSHDLDIRVTGFLTPTSGQDVEHARQGRDAVEAIQ